MTEKYPTYNYSEEDANTDLARIVKLDNPESYPFDSFHAHKYNEILVFIKGGGTHNINFKNHIIADYSLHLLAANDLHWVEREQASYGFAIVYKEQFLFKLQEFTNRNELVQLFSNSKIINLSASEKEDFKFIFQELLNLNHQKLYTLSLIGTFLSKIANATQNIIDIPQNTDPLVQDLIQQINVHFREQQFIKFYAGKLNISIGTLSKRIKNATGITVKKLIQDKLLKEAKRMIIQSNNSNITMIAYELGFKEPAHFSNWFKKTTGVSAKDYRIDY